VRSSAASPWPPPSRRDRPARRAAPGTGPTLPAAGSAAWVCRSPITALIANHGDVPANCDSAIAGRMRRGTASLTRGPAHWVLEEAHRRISEYYYKNSTAVATELAEALIGKRFKGTGATRSLAQQNGFDQIVAAYNDAYMARTRARSAAANARFDEITDHGRKPIDEAEAFALAVASDPEP